MDSSTVKGNKMALVKNDKSPESSKFAFNKVMFSVVPGPRSRPTLWRLARRMRAG
jgi:peptide/nickel transport system substrate-binding protein